MIRFVFVKFSFNVAISHQSDRSSKAWNGMTLLLLVVGKIGCVGHFNITFCNCILGNGHRNIELFLCVYFFQLFVA